MSKPATDDAKIDPCRSCPHGRMSGKCITCPHNGPQSFGESLLWIAIALALCVLLALLGAKPTEVGPLPWMVK